MVGLLRGEGGRRSTALSSCGESSEDSCLFLYPTVCGYCPTKKIHIKSGAKEIRNPGNNNGNLTWVSNNKNFIIYFWAKIEDAARGRWERKDLSFPFLIPSLFPWFPSFRPPLTPSVNGHPQHCHPLVSQRPASSRQPCPSCSLYKRYKGHSALRS